MMGCSERTFPALTPVTEGAQSHRALIALVRAIGRTVMVYDATGAVILQSDDVATLLVGEPESEAILGNARHVARVHLGALAAGAATDEWVRGAPSLVRSRGRGYWLQPIYVLPGIFAPDGSVAVVIQRSGDGAPVETTAVARHFGLTPREDRVLHLLLDRYTTSEIADALGVSPHTVRHHIERVYRKTQVRGRTELLRLLAPRVASHGGRPLMRSFAGVQ